MTGRFIQIDQQQLERDFNAQIDAIQIGTLTSKGQRCLTKDRALQPVRSTTYMTCEQQGWLMKLTRPGQAGNWRDVAFLGDGTMFAQIYRQVGQIEAQISGPFAPGAIVVITEGDTIVRPNATQQAGIIHVDQNRMDTTSRDVVYDIEDDSGLATSYLTGYRGTEDPATVFIDRHSGHEFASENGFAQQQDYKAFLQEQASRFRRAPDFAVTRRYTCTPHMGAYNNSDAPVRRRRGRLRIYQP